jgi:hypothetical protein
LGKIYPENGKPISLGWKVNRNDYISEVNEVKLDCFPLITISSNDVNNNDFVSKLNSRMCGPVMVNICSENHWS